MLAWIKEIRNIMLLALIVVAAGSAIYAWYKPPSIVTNTEYVKVPEIKTVTKINRVEVPGPTKIVTIEKKVVTEKLKLPDWIKSDANLQIIATAEIPPYKGTTNAVAVLDVKEGDSEIIVKQVPLPLFGFENDREVGIRAGYGIKDATEATIYGRWTFMRVGNFHLGAYGESNSQGDAKIQAELSYRF
jgi:hypothetical protein